MKSNQNKPPLISMGLTLILIGWGVVFLFMAYHFIHLNMNIGISRLGANSQINDDTPLPSISSISKFNLNIPNLDAYNTKFLPELKGRDIDVTEKYQEPFSLVTKSLFTDFGQLYAVYDTANHKYNILLNSTLIGSTPTSRVIGVHRLSNNNLVIIFNGSPLASSPAYTLLEIGYDLVFFKKITNDLPLLNTKLSANANCINLNFIDHFKTTNQNLQYCGQGSLTRQIAHNITIHSHRNLHHEHNRLNSSIIV